MIVVRGSDGIYCAFCNANGSPCIAYDADRQQAIEFCLELVKENNNG